MIVNIDYKKYPNFKKFEFQCRHCGKDGVQEELVAFMQSLRQKMGIPLTINSGYRCKDHPIEAKKARPGEHSEGLACDVGIRGKEALTMIRLALAQGATRIGVQQSGSSRYIHIGLSKKLPSTIWSY